MYRSIGNIQFTGAACHPRENDVRDRQTPQPHVGRSAGAAVHLPTRQETRPEGDRRSAGEIFYDNPILDRAVLSPKWDRSRQGQQRLNTLVENLKHQVGDFTASNPDRNARANAMFRLAQVVNHIDNDPHVHGARSGGRGDGYLDRGPEEDRLTAFSQQGYSALQERREPVRQVAHPQRRVPFGQRSVEQITANPLFKALGKVLNAQEREAFKARVGGDWEDTRLPVDTRAFIAGNAEKVLKRIDEQGGHYSTAHNGRIEGADKPVNLLPVAFQRREDFTDAGSEARRLSDFAQFGYGALYYRY